MNEYAKRTAGPGNHARGYIRATQRPPARVHYIGKKELENIGKYGMGWNMWECMPVVAMCGKCCEYNKVYISDIHS